VAHPVRTNKIPRQVPAQAWYMHPLFSILIGGILPFGAVFIELFFILTSMWLHQVCNSLASPPPARRRHCLTPSEPRSSTLLPCGDERTRSRAVLLFCRYSGLTALLCSALNQAPRA
jgi:hypothetical protein